MSNLDEMIREYRDIVQQEQTLHARKEQLRVAILAALADASLRFAASPYGSAVCGTRYKLIPRREPVLALLHADDLFPFAHFTSKRVKELLVPKFGRDKLLPLFDITQSNTLVVKAPAAPGDRAPL